ncbi:hypothetical protein YC2023_086551 [Brassica napus]
MTASLTCTGLHWRTYDGVVFYFAYSDVHNVVDSAARASDDTVLVYPPRSTARVMLRVTGSQIGWRYILDLYKYLLLAQRESSLHKKEHCNEDFDHKNIVKKIVLLHGSHLSSLLLFPLFIL